MEKELNPEGKKLLSDENLEEIAGGGSTQYYCSNYDQRSPDCPKLANYNGAYCRYKDTCNYGTYTA